MKNSLLLLLGMAILLGCKKDEAAPPPKDYSAFLANTNPSFRGAMGGFGFNWRFGAGTFQMGMGYANGSGLCIPDDPERIAYFQLTGENGSTNRVMLYTPIYDAAAEASYKQIFTVGKHPLGNYKTQYHLKLHKDGKAYESFGTGAQGTIEILKTTAFDDYLGKRLRVWYVIHAQLSNCGCTQGAEKLSDGLMVAEFLDYKMGN